MDWKQLIMQGEEPMRKTIDKMKTDLGSLRTGRASITLVEGLKVESYGSMMPLNQLANLNLSDPHTIEIKPWDVSQISNIEKAIQKSDLGLTPNNDSKVIRLSVPKLSEDRRKDLIKIINKMAEDFRVSIRNERRHILEALKKAEKDKTATEDDRKKGEADLQKMTDIYIKKIDETLKQKEKDILEV